MDLDPAPLLVIWIFHATFGFAVALCAMLIGQRKRAVIVLALIIMCFVMQVVSSFLDTQYDREIREAESLSQTLELMGRFQSYHFLIVTSQLAAWASFWIYGLFILWKFNAEPGEIEKSDY